MASPPALARRLGTADAVWIGLGSMIGAGVFAVWAPAAAAAGTGLLFGLVLAGVVAWCNATSSAQLAAAYPTSGGTYVYGREQLGPWWGFVAGWGFVVGKTASCAAMALTFAAYAVGPAWARPVAAGAVIALAAVNYRGVTRTAALTRILVLGSGAALLIVLGAGWAGVDLDAVTLTLTLDGVGGPYGVLQSAGLLFFAFAGYARIATMGEEVRDPERSIPRAIMLALGIVVVLYAVVALTLLTVLGPELLAASAAPLAELAPDLGWVALVARVGASVAALGALLGLVAGVGRTSLAMARERDLPRWLDAVHPVHRVPHHAEVALAVVVAVLVLTVDLREAIGFSSFGVLTYYFIANASAFTQEPSRRRFPRAAQVAGMVGCAVLALTLPVNSVLAGLAVFAVGIAYRALRLRRRVR